MRDESNVIAFTLALKFAFIVTRTCQQLNFSLLSMSFSHATLRHQKIIRSYPWPSKQFPPHGMCFQGTVLCFDASTKTIVHISVGVSPIGSQILIEWSVPDITNVRFLGHFTCSCCCGSNGLFIKHRVTSSTCAYHSLQASSPSRPLLERTQGLLGEMRFVFFYPSFASERMPHLFFLDILFQSIDSRLWGKNLGKH
jgi:hypothetical protein